MIGERPLSLITSDQQVLAELETRRVEGRGRASGPGTRTASELELKVRRRIRGLAQGVMAYQVEKRRFVLNLRRRSLAREQLIAPPQPDGTLPRVRHPMAELTAIQGQILENRDRLVGPLGRAPGGTAGPAPRPRLAPRDRLGHLPRPVRGPAQREHAAPHRPAGPGAPRALLWSPRCPSRPHPLPPPLCPADRPAARIPIVGTPGVDSRKARHGLRA